MYYECTSSQFSISVITFGWVQQQNPSKRDDRYAQLTRGAFIINDFLQNPNFSKIVLECCINNFVLLNQIGSNWFKLDQMGSNCMYIDRAWVSTGVTARVLGTRGIFEQYCPRPVPGDFGNFTT